MAYNLAKQNMRNDVIDILRRIQELRKDFTILLDRYYDLNFDNAEDLGNGITGAELKDAVASLITWMGQPASQFYKTNWNKITG